MDDQDMVMDDQRKKGGGKFIIIIIILLVVLAGAAFGLRMFAPGLIPGWGEKKSDGGGEASGAVKEAPKKTLFPMPPFIVNLMDPSGKRYLKLTLTLELDAPTTQQAVEANMLQIKDAILVLLSSKAYDDISTVEGKRRLKNEITMRCNTFLPNGKVDNVYFSEFVVQ